MEGRGGEKADESCCMSNSVLSSGSNEAGIRYQVSGIRYQVSVDPMCILGI